jgi:hypothetical protein
LEEIFPKFGRISSFSRMDYPKYIPKISVGKFAKIPKFLGRILLENLKIFGRTISEIPKVFG